MPRFSIVVPTTRPRLVLNALRSAIAQTFGDFEIVVSDNSDSGCSEIVRGFSDSRIRHIRPEGYLTLIDHWNFAFSNAVGEIQLLLCDDDALAPNLLEIIDREMRRDGSLQTISWGFSSYMEADHWMTKSPAHLITERFSGARLRYAAHDLLTEMFASGTGKFGAIKRKAPFVPFSAYSRPLITQIRSALNGSLFLPIDPMTSAAAAALCFVDKHLRIDLPLIVLGNPIDSSSGHIANTSTFDRMTQTLELMHVPIKSMYVFPNHGAEALARVQAALPDHLGRYEIDLANYFLACRMAIRELERFGTDTAQAMLAWQSAFDKADYKIQCQVTSKLRRGSGIFQKIRAFSVAAKRAACTALDVVGLTNPTHQRVMRTDGLGLANIFDCAQYLGRITREDDRSPFASGYKKAG